MTLRHLFSSARIAACFDDAALIGGMLAFERALARAQGACGAIPAPAAARIDDVGARAKFDVDTPGGRGAARGHARDPVRQAPDRAGRASRRRGVALCALGRDQPGSARYGAGALRKAGIATTARAVGSTRRCAGRTGRCASCNADRGAHACCNLRRRYRSASRPPCGSTRSRERDWRCDALRARVRCCNSGARAACLRRSAPRAAGGRAARARARPGDDCDAVARCARSRGATRRRSRHCMRGDGEARDSTSRC